MRHVIHGDLKLSARGFWNPFAVTIRAQQRSKLKAAWHLLCTEPPSAVRAPRALTAEYAGSLASALVLCCLEEVAPPGGRGAAPGAVVTRNTGSVRLQQVGKSSVGSKESNPFRKAEASKEQPSCSNPASALPSADCHQCQVTHDSLF